MKHSKSSRLILLGVSALLSALLVPALATPAHACSCIPESRMSMYERATDVFIGTVASGPEALAGGPAATPAPGWNTVGSGGKVLYTLDVGETFKGGATGRVEVSTPSDSAACGYPFEVGKQFLVFARRGTHHLHTDLCMGTAGGESLAPATEEIRKIAEFSRRSGGH